MHPDSLEKTLAAYARRPAPAADPQLPAHVWSAIAERRAAGWRGRFSLGNWQDILGERACLAAALALALAAGVGPALWAARVSRAEALRRSLHLEAFAPEALASLSPPAGSGR